ncbi:DUF2029 domain-containing protein [Candidatus Sumerlaeota bacterium]|nr:DUF2029 domain-containing protein [Candidatus Sumerlaeota bacterium]
MTPRLAHPSRPRSQRTLALLIGTVLWILACLAMVRRSWIAGEAGGIGLVYELAAGIPLAVWSVLLWRGFTPSFGRAELAALLLGAALVRIPLLTLPPAQSDDIYRILWEGRVQAAGRNPFRYAPGADELSDLRDENWALINHPEYSAIYPPLAQLSFVLCAAISPSVAAMKILFTALDLLVLVALLRWLRRLGRSPAWATIWAFHPLVIVEFSGNGHLDSLMVLMVVLALWSLEEGWDARAALALTGAIGAKLIPLLLLPYFFWKMKRRWLLALPPLLIAGSYLPYASAWLPGLISSLWIYQRDWLYNAPIFDFARDRLFDADGFQARWWFYGALAVLGGIAWARRTEPAAAVLLVLGFYQIAGPVVHPWYLAVFIPLICVRSGAWPWLWLTLSVPLIYHDESNAWIRAIVWGPFVLALAVEAARRVHRIVRGTAQSKERPA